MKDELTRREQVVWAATYLDKNAYFRIDRRNPNSSHRTIGFSYRGVIAVRDRDSTPLIFLKNLFGGSLTPAHSSYVWWCGDRQATILLEQILPLLKTKRNIDVGKLILELYAEICNRKPLPDKERLRREAIYREACKYKLSRTETGGLGGIATQVNRAIWATP